MYGNADSVAAMASTWSRDRHFYDADAYLPATDPSLSQVNEWLDELSSTLDLALADEGFVTPLSTANGMKSASAIVQEITADLCHAAHRSGRFFTKNAFEGGLTPLRAAMDDLHNWVIKNKVGLKNIGEQTVGAEASGRHTATFDMM